jgi:cellulose synthase operon protein C
MTRFIRTIATLAITVFVAAWLAAQTQGVDILLSKARSLEARGRMDLAAQNWKQALLVNPNQTEAIGGLARYAKQNGEAQEERSYLDRLKKINPKDPAIAAIEKMHVITPQERDRLDEAGRLAMQHKPDEAMKIYKEVFGNEPPSGKWAEPYYQTEAASSGGREKAISQLRRLGAGDPGNEIYRLWLARALVYDPKTRMEGMQKLESLRDPGAVEQARTEWRQALMWEKENPAALASVNAYLQRYPEQELQGIQKSLQDKQEHMAEEASKERGFQALRGKDMATAEAKFQDVLQRSPNDANAVAGMAFVRLNQKRFDDAVTLFDRARTLAPKRADVREGYETAKFWSLMQQGASALLHNESEAAINAYQEALGLHPRDEQAMLGIAQAQVRQKRLPDAEAEFQQVLNQSPNNTDAIAGLAFLRVDEKKFDDAVVLFEKARKLVPNRPDVEQGYKDAKYWSLMQQGARELDRNREGIASSDYRQALALRPGAVDALHGLAGATERGGKYVEAAQAYSQLVNANSADAQSWLGLMRVQILGKDPKSAIQTAERVPLSVKPQIETRPDYLSQLALAYYSTKQTDEGNRMLDRAMSAAVQSDPEGALNARLEVASALMDQGKTDRAIQIYQQATKLHPENAIAWEGLVGAYSRGRDFAQAKVALSSMPQETYEGAAKNPNFLNSVAAVYSAGAECGKAEELLGRSLSLDRAAGRLPAEGTQLQLADIWLREQQYAKAQQGYREIINKNQSSPEAWRGYITALHNQRDDRTVLAEMQRMPAAVHAELEKESSFLVLLAGAHASLKHDAETVRLLEKARAIYVEQQQTPPAELDVQLSWAMLNDRQNDPRLFLQKVRARTDLTDTQRATIDQIQAAWSVRAADEAVQEKKPEHAIAVLTDAQHDLPNDPKLYAALASVYTKQHNRERALSVYESWGMKGATAGDYLAAAGTALAAHKNELVDFYLGQGLRQYPNDPGLLEMKGKQVIAHGNYKEGQTYLKSALRAAKNPAMQRQSLMEEDSHAVSPGDGGGDAAKALTVPSSQVPACRQTSSHKTPELRVVKLIAASYEQQDDASQNDANQASQTGATPSNGNQNSQTTPAQDNAAPQSANQDGAVNPQTSPEKQEQIQDEIDVVQNRNTPYGDIGSNASGRAGDLGIDRLIIEDGFAGGSVVGGNAVRLDIKAHGLYLFSGTPNGRSKSIFGTLAPGTTFAQQATGGIEGELQVSTGTFGLDFGATPQEFPVQNVIGGIRFQPFGGPLTFTAMRDSVKDSLLSYAGVRDPGTGVIWGGVVANTGTVQLEHKGSRVGGYSSVSFSYITGKNVPDNWDASGSAGFYVVVAKGLSVGVSATGMHYDKNLSFFSLGQGGYFSPQQYGLAAIPISWFSRHRRFEYEIRASLGAQYIEQDSSSFFPTRLNTTPPTIGFYSSTNDVGPNYNFVARLGYRVAPHVYFDTFATANNARNYATQTVGFSLKFLVHQLPTHTDLHVNSVPDWRGNQPFGIE